MTARLLVVAKAPVPGLAKTRLGATVGLETSADLAAAALLDTLEAGALFGPGYVALAGDLTEAARSREIRDALAGWTVFDQEGASFADRLANAHAVAGADGHPVLQIGMDTPQVTGALLRTAAARMRTADGVLGPATDGGWWLLGLRDPSRAGVLRDVPMSVPATGALTERALAADGVRLARVAELRDVDDRADADAVAQIAPATRFAHAWRDTVRALGAAS